jgi:type IV secretion system protein VirB1
MLLATLLLTTAFLAECGPTVEPTTTRAIIQVESRGDALAIGDNHLRTSFAPKTKREAVSLASELLGQGHSLDLGLMQINSSHLSPLRLSLEDAFDPCRNVRAGTTILADFYRQHQTGDPTYTLMKALSANNTGQAWKGAGYVNRILQAAGAQYRIQFVPVPDAEAALPQTTRKRTKTGRRASPLFFSNTTSALAASKGEQPGF